MDAAMKRILAFGPSEYNACNGADLFECDFDSEEDALADGMRGMPVGGTLGLIDTSTGDIRVFRRIRGRRWELIE